MALDVKLMSRGDRGCEEDLFLVFMYCDEISSEWLLINLFQELCLGWKMQWRMNIYDFSMNITVFCVQQKGKVLSRWFWYQ